MSLSRSWVLGVFARVLGVLAGASIGCAEALAAEIVRTQQTSTRVRPWYSLSFLWYPHDAPGVVCLFVCLQRKLEGLDEEDLHSAVRR